jgi:hypothetical protein
MKITLKIFIVVLVVQSCTLFEKDEKLLSEHKKTNGEEIKIYFVGVGATTNDVIQVRKSGSDKLLWVSDKYNCLKTSELINDTSLRLVLTDTGYHNYDNKPDTVLVNIK